MTVQVDKIIRSKRKTVALVITANATLVVRSPQALSNDRIVEIVQAKQRWINEKLAKIRERKANHKAKKFVDGEGFLYLGDYYRLTTVPGNQSIRLAGKYILFPQSLLIDPEKAMIEWYRKEAIEVLSKRTERYANTIGLSYEKLTITDAARRWGSCGRNGTINLSWRLVLAPLPIIDYVIVHELCHIVEKNHSKAFWEKVVTIMPNYKECVRWLIENQQLLDL